jgi:predicted esterase
MRHMKSKYKAKSLFYLLILIPTIILGPGCRPSGANKDESRPLEKPIPPLQLAAPNAMPHKLDGADLTTLDEAELLGQANQAMGQADYARAAAFQYWYVQKAKTGQYNLACFLARLGQRDAAFYWLQQAALEEGVDAPYADEDDDLKSLRQDARWAKVRRYLADVNHYFETAPLARTVLVLPSGYKKESAIPVILWAHGLGATPENFVTGSGQQFADQLNLAVVGVSGTKARGPHSFVWAEDVKTDAQRFRDALAEIADRVTIKKGCVVLFGFSQGAQVALNIGASYPEEYAGAIALSPGGMSPTAQRHLDHVETSPVLSHRGFVISWGAQEDPGNVSLAVHASDRLRQLKAKLIQKGYPGVSAHAFPADFDERFPEWVSFVLKAREN